MRIFLVLAVLCGGCKSESKPAASSETKAAEPAAKPAAGSNAEATPDAEGPITGPAPAECALITREEAEKLMGVKSTASGGTDIGCMFSGPGSWYNVMTQVFTEDAEAKYKQFRDTDIADPAVDKDLKGIGTKAYRRGSGMSFGILANNKFASFSVGIEPGKPRPTPEVVESVMKGIAGRM